MAAILEQSDSRSSADVLAEILSSLENISTWVESDQVCYGTIGSSWKSPSEDLKTALTVLNAAAGSIHSSATKFGLLAKTSAKAIEIQSLCDEIVDFCDKLTSSFRIAIANGSAEPLSRLLHIKVKAVLHAVCDLVRAAQALGARGGAGTLAPAAGVVWAACDDLQKVPKNNRDAYRFAFMGWSLEIKSTVDEFQELVQASKEAPREPEQAEGGEQPSEERARLQTMDNDEFFAMEDENYTLEEAGGAAALVGVLQLTRRALRAAMDATRDACDRTEGQLAWVDQLYRRGQDAVELATDLGLCLYPPLERGELEAGKTKYFLHLEGLLAHLAAAEGFLGEEPLANLHQVRELFEERRAQVDAYLATMPSQEDCR